MFLKDNKRVFSERRKGGAGGGGGGVAGGREGGGGIDFAVQRHVPPHPPFHRGNLRGIQKAVLLVMSQMFQQHPN